MSIINVDFNQDNFDLWRQKTNLIALQQGDFNRLIVPLTSPISGTVTSIGDSLVGLGTLFLTELVVGSRVKDIDTGTERIISEITSNTTAKTSVAFTPSLSNSQIVTMDMITALNSTYLSIGNAQRDILIRAIAMS